MTKTTEKWYASWFDTPYYHILYKDRDYTEAQAFMDNLTNYLNLPENGKILDLACGKGRHSIYLNKLGYNVTGVDLSEQSITHAKQYENDSLKFDVHDMTKPYTETFDAVFNLFTSFGYFENEETNARVLKNFKLGLRENGHVVIDFLNLSKVRAELIPNHEILKKGVKYKIEKRITNQFIIKDINVIDGDNQYAFQEKVQALDLEKFERYSREAGLEIVKIFGDYSLNDFSKESSDRLILVLQ